MVACRNQKKQTLLEILNPPSLRRKQGITRSSTFKEDIHHPPQTNDNNPNNNPSLPSLTSSHSFSPSSSSLAAQAIRASTAYRQSTLAPAFAAAGESVFPSDSQLSRAFPAYEDPSLKNESKGFWGVLARKAKAIIEEEDEDHHHAHASQKQLEESAKSRWQMPETSAAAFQSQQQPQQYTYESFRNVENQPSFRRGLDKITYSLNQIGDTFEKAFEEGKTIVENKTADLKLQIRRKGEDQNQTTHHQTQLKATRDVAMATAAKAKLLLRELKSVKADLAFAKQRCAQLEEENKLLREKREKGQNLADDDLIRLQLETLLAEKARLAHDNSVYARENRFLREIVEYHQLTMQDVVYLDEGKEEVTEVYPRVSQMLCVSPFSPTSSPFEEEKQHDIDDEDEDEDEDDDDDDDDDEDDTNANTNTNTTNVQVATQPNDATLSSA